MTNCDILQNKLCIIVTTASLRRFKQYPQSLFDRSKKNSVYHCKLEFYYAQMAAESV